MPYLLQPLRELAAAGGEIAVNYAPPFAMTYAAVTLRLWLIALIPLLGNFPSAHALVPFLSWVPNLIVVEPLLRRRQATDPA